MSGNSSGIKSFIVWLLVLSFLGYGGFHLAQGIQKTRYERRDELFRSETSDFGGEFDRKLHLAMPAGLSGSDLSSRLSALGFKVNNARREANFDLMVAPCTNRWIVAWQVDGADAVTTYQGRYYRSCLF